MGWVSALPLPGPRTPPGNARSALARSAVVECETRSGPPHTPDWGGVGAVAERTTTQEGTGVSGRSALYWWVDSRRGARNPLKSRPKQTMEQAETTLICPATWVLLGLRAAVGQLPSRLRHPGGPMDVVRFQPAAPV